MTITPYYERDGITIYVGDNREVLPALDVTVSAVVTDPPYGLSFMGKDWDHSVPGEAFWRIIADAMKPGAHLLSFGGTRTFHRIAVAIEDAGFELRDTLMWLYGSGFPKSHDVSKAIDKRGGYPHLAAEIGKALKEARESRGMSASECDRIFCDGTTNWSWFEGRPKGQRAPTPETFARIVEQWPELSTLADTVAEAERAVVGQSAHKSGIGNAVKGHYTVGGTKAEHVDITAPATPEAAQWAGWGTALKPAYEPIILARKPLCGTVAANVLQHGTGALNIDSCRIPGDPWKPVAPNSGGRSGGVMGASAEHPGGEPHTAGRWPANVILDEVAAQALDRQSGELTSNSGKPFTRNLDKLRNTYGAFAGAPAERGFYGDSGGASRFFYVAKASRKERGEGNVHPTVKPLALMRYLVTLITPPGGIVLDPFAGSGSTLVACAQLGFPAIGIELSEEYCEIIARRVDHALNERPAVVQPSLLEMVAD